MNNKNKLIFPLEKYNVNGFKFGKNTNNGIHLGEDIICSAGTKVKCIGKGIVEYCALHPGTKTKSNWGNIIIIAHKNPVTEKIFYSLYGHLENHLVKKGDNVSIGKVIGTVGKANTPQNGWWDTEHLHFAIFTGRWTGEVLPGYFKEEDNRTKLSDWPSPEEFIREYNR